MTNYRFDVPGGGEPPQIINVADLEPFDLTYQMWAAAMCLSDFAGLRIPDEAWPSRLAAAHDMLCVPLHNHLPEDEPVVQAAQAAHDLLKQALTGMYAGQPERAAHQTFQAWRTLTDTLLPRAWPLTQGPQEE